MPVGARSRGWTEERLRRTGEHLVVVDDDLVAALRRRLPETFEAPTPATLDAFRSEMASLLGDVALAVRGRLGADGPGLAVVAHDDLDALSDGQLATLAFGIAVLLGRPARQRSHEQYAVVVQDHRPGDVETSPGYLSNGRMGMHTDPTDVAALACLSTSAAGGENLFVSAAAVHDVLAREAPAVLEAFLQPWTWDLRGAQRPDAGPLVTSPVFSNDGGDVRCRFGWLLLREGARASGRLTTEVAEALDLFEEVARRPELTFRYTPRRGQSVWMDNYRVLHGREAFEDRPDAGQVRRLLRIWLWLHERAALPPSFVPFSLAVDRGSLTAEGPLDSCEGHGACPIG